MGVDRPGATYRGVANHIRWEIKEKRLPAGSRLPSELEYATRFGCNRITIRRAMGILQTEGLVAAQQGRGRFVLGPDGERGIRDDAAHERVEAAIRDFITDHAPGALLPDAVYYMAMYRVSAVTVRRVLRRLSTQDLITRTRYGGYVIL